MPSPPPNGFEEFFGSPPHVRFLESYVEGRPDEEHREALKRAPGVTLEQKFRYTAESLGHRTSNSVGIVLNDLCQVVADEGPFDGLIGNSEGACVAATFLVNEAQRNKGNKGLSIRCAVFMSGGPPLKPNGEGVYLADECGQMIEIPTLHVIGYNDPMRDAALVLYHLCDQQSAGIVDHGKGHLVPRDPRSCEFMIKGIRDLIARTCEQSLASE